ncbi:tetratricopeptide repeat (TPR)-like superfamily protein isoform X2 [Wolffia australiana]
MASAAGVEAIRRLPLERSSIDRREVRFCRFVARRQSPDAERAWRNNIWKRYVIINVSCSSRGAFTVCLAQKSRGFGAEPDNKNNRNARTKEGRSASTDPRLTPVQPASVDSFAGAPGVGGIAPGKPKNVLSDRQFIERLEVVKRSAQEKKKAEQEKFTGEIDYDAPTVSDAKSISIFTKVGVGIAVVLFGLIFAFGDFGPSVSVKEEQSAVDESKLSEEERKIRQIKLEEYQEILSRSSDDLAALEGAAVTSAELGDYGLASSLLEKLTNQKKNDPDAFRLLGEVKYALQDFEGSVAAYRKASSVSETVNFEILRGLTNAFLAANKPAEAVQALLSAREILKSGSGDSSVLSGMSKEKDLDIIDPIQVDLLLGKAYSDWGHVGDAVAVYDQLISTYPNDFRGYLAKGIILKQNGNSGDAERMFIQARFFAPDNIKSFVDGYSRR